jgi:tetratricopeptide (TPR) repeat protein
MLGVALTDRGDLDGAVAAFRALLGLAPTNAGYLQSLGTTLREKGDRDEAVATFRAAIRLNPSDPMAHYELAVTLMEVGDLDGAAAAWQTVARLGPKDRLFAMDPQANLRKIERWRELLPRLADLAAGRARPKSTAEALDFANLCAEPFQRRYLLAVRLYTDVFAADGKLLTESIAGHRVDAAVCAVLAASGRDAELTQFGVDEWAHLTTTALRWLRADLAVRTRQAQDPQRLPAVRGLVAIVFKRNPKLAAVRDPGRLAAMPAPDRRAWQALWADVDGLTTLGDPEGAAARHREAVRLDPTNVPALLKLGQALAAQGDRTGAIGSYRRVIEIEPANVTAHFWLGMDLAALRRWDEAVAEYRQATRLDPRFAAAHEYLGDALRNTGDLDGSIASYRSALRIDPKRGNAQRGLDLALWAKAERDAPREPGPQPHPAGR